MTSDNNNNKLMDPFNMWVLVQYIEDFEEYLKEKSYGKDNYFYDSIIIKEAKKIVVESAAITVNHPSLQNP